MPIPNYMVKVLEEGDIGKIQATLVDRVNRELSEIDKPDPDGYPNNWVVTPEAKEMIAMLKALVHRSVYCDKFKNNPRRGVSTVVGIISHMIEAASRVDALLDPDWTDADSDRVNAADMTDLLQLRTFLRQAIARSH
jgi:hypothetical protein